ncbi:MAG: hypothetical protein D6740_01660, partial [Alphaproteobacteria bacterium]
RLQAAGLEQRAALEVRIARIEALLAARLPDRRELWRRARRMFADRRTAARVARHAQQQLNRRVHALLDEILPSRAEAGGGLS